MFWCSTLIKDDSDDSQGLSDGICKDCYSNLMSKKVGSTESFLNQIDYPIFYIAEDVRALWGNESAERITHKSNEKIKGQLGGDIFECIHSKERGGCGKTVFCKSCSIRRLVEDTYKTGQAHFNVPASLKVRPESEELIFQ